MAQAEEAFEHQAAEVKSLERRIRLRLGRLLDELAELEEEIEKLQEKIKHLRQPDAFNAGYLPVEEQFRRTWETTEDPGVKSSRDPYGGSEPIEQIDKKQFKKLYRKLARRYHPDLAVSDRERVDRNEQMAALNEAYKAGSLVELMAFAGDSDDLRLERTGSSNTQEALIRVLELEVSRIERRTKLIYNEIENIHNLPVVQLSLDIKVARRNGRDLLSEMSVDLKDRVARLRVERDLLKAQLEQLKGKS